MTSHHLAPRGIALALAALLAACTTAPQPGGRSVIIERTIAPGDCPSWQTWTTASVIGT